MTSYSQFLNLKFDHISSEEGLPHSTIHGITKDKYGFMWFGTWSGLCRYDGYKFRVYHYEQNNNKSLINNRIHNILKDKDENIWILTFNEDYVCRYNYESDNFDRILKRDLAPGFLFNITRRNHLQNVNFTFKDHQWNLDTYTNSVVETHKPTGAKKFYQSNALDLWALNDAYISDIYLDDQNILWLGTYSYGITKTNLEGNPFNYVDHNPHSKNSLIENTIRSICQDKEGNLWIGTRSKGISIRMKDGRYKHLQYESGNPHSIKSDYVKKIFCDSKGLIWIGNKKGIDVYDPKTKKIKRKDFPNLFDITVYGIVEDLNADLWLGTWNGVYKYVRKEDRLIHFNPDIYLPSKFVWSIMMDHKQQLWVGTEGGGIVVLKENDDKLSTILNLKHDEKTNNTLSDNRIYNIFEDRNKTIWIGTGNGLDEYNPQTKKIKNHSGKDQEFPKGTIAGVIEDKSGVLWISHKHGITRYNKRKKSFHHFSQQDGLQSNEFAEGAVYKSPTTDLLYFGGNRGVNFFVPDSIKTSNKLPKIVLTELQVFNRPVEVNDTINGRVILQKPLYLTDKINFTHEDKSFSIEFSALYYINPKGNKYAYMLEGFDEDWIHTDASQRLATYANLKPGNYTFKVKASNSGGLWTENAATLAIHVAPPWWSSTMAYVVYTLIGILLLLSSYYYLVRYAKLKNKLAFEAILHEKERELHESKMQFFTNISHEIKTPLTLILSPVQQLIKLCADNKIIQKQLTTMQKNGDRLLKIVNQLLDVRRLESGHETLITQRADIISFVQDNVDQFQELARTKGISLAFDTKLEQYNMDFDADKVGKVINNLLSNAIKFTAQKGNILVQLSLAEESLMINFYDNGRGIEKTDLVDVFAPFKQSKLDNPTGTGLGLAYTKALIELHGGKITVQSGPELNPFKTLFSVHIPIRTNLVLSNDIDHENLDLVEVSNQQDTSQHEEIEDVEKSYLKEKHTILLVEDNPDMRAYLRNYFSQDYHILEAENGLIGVEIAHKHTPDLIISDVMMPKMDGITLCRLIKSDLIISHIPVILLTARSLEEYEKEGLQTGADDYIIKPFNLDLLDLKIRNQFLHRMRLQEKFKLKVSVAPTEIEVVSADEQLVQKVLQYVEENISDSELRIDSICHKVGMSRTQLYRKMKALTGFSMADMIREIRLKRAQQLLRDNKLNVNEVAYSTGFSDADYFRKCFKTKFKVSPSEYAKQYQVSRN